MAGRCVGVVAVGVDSRPDKPTAFAGMIRPWIDASWVKRPEGCYTQSPLLFRLEQ